MPLGSPRHESLLRDVAVRLEALKPRLASARLTPQIQGLLAAISRHVTAANEYLLGARRGMSLPRMDVEMHLEQALARCKELEAALNRM
ncbi:hypothetical protein JYK02_33045 [Corallococcus macrosporus]|uniref:Uncharacterized protein n=1 Tax=Corallococcus macrosporus TaxID=35 RepID=A0ABS3DLY2_9BACT|nr:hypothetical protein [Corallococcus macrosporus]MBN8232351.1 hypothetical protein [Corallococcus macrosporus]